MNFVRSIHLIPAILININIIIGGGIFINLNPLNAMGGTASFLAYVVAAMLLLPVVSVLAALAQRHPESGGLYVYTKNYMHPFIAFLGGWGYFVGKSISVGVLSNVLVSLFQKAVPFFQGVPSIVLTAGLIYFFILLNILGAKVQGRIQWLFIAAKSLPMILMALLLFQYGDLSQISLESFTVDTLTGMLPIAVFAMVGFEATCTLAHLFYDPERTIVRALLYGFSLVAGSLALFQLSVSLLLPTGQSFSFPLAFIAERFFGQGTWVTSFLYTCVYTSMLGGAFSILNSNCWNLHRLAVQGHLPFRSWLTKLTAHQVPWVSLLVGGAIGVFGIAITQNQEALQSMSVFGVVSSFACAMLASWPARDLSGRYIRHWVIKLAACLSTGYLMYVAFKRILLVGVSIPYLLLVSIGVVLALYYEISGKRAVIAANLQK